jgi:hypothetical protein
VVFSDVRYGEECVCAMPALVDAVVAVSPFAFITVVTLPVTRISPCAADVAEDACLESPVWVVLADEGPRCGGTFGERVPWSSILVSAEDVGIFVGRWVATRWSLLLVKWPGSPAEAVPVLTALLSTVAGLTEVVDAVVAAGAIVV